jgi:menaquinone-dependent protoporphyrinogen oxidase
MTASVLVAYASRYGSTAGIAEAIGEILRERGLTTDVRRADDVREIADYDTVVVGSGVYMGRWDGAAVGFLKRFEHDLARRPTWLFSSGPTGGDVKAEARMAATLAEQPDPPGNIAKVAKRIGPRDHRTFAGRVGEDMGGFFARWIPKGDWRDFDAVRAWAATIADASPVPAG